MSIVKLKIYRGYPGDQYWDEFELQYRHGMNIITALMDIQKNPINVHNQRVLPISWEAGCLEEVCGSCSMLINGVPRQACTALIEEIIDTQTSTTITLAPFTKFPLVRDLVVDRSIMFSQIKKIEGWVEIDGYYTTGFGPNISQDKQQVRYYISCCMTCGCCSEACPQINSSSSFIGPSPIAQVRLFSIHPTSHLKTPQRLRILQGEGGIGSCGNAQNCQRVCPKKVPLTDSIAWAGKETLFQGLRDYFRLQEEQP
jgi:succinate dehydrogenase / fumarate reductase, iron-sulfur subunit